MIISGSLGQYVVPRLHKLSTVDSILILCDNKEYHEQWTKEWSKIKGAFTEITLICDALKQATQQCERNAISISIIATSDSTSKKNFNHLNSSFMYTQIMKEILLTITFETKHFKEFIDYCHSALADNPVRSDHFIKLENSYRNHTPILMVYIGSFCVFHAQPCSSSHGCKSNCYPGFLHY
jgi:hypothetical protein